MLKTSPAAITPGAYLRSQFLDRPPPPTPEEKGGSGPRGGSEHYVSQAYMPKLVARFEAIMKGRPPTTNVELMLASGLGRETCRKYMWVLLKEKYVAREGEALWSWKGEACK